MNDEQRSHNWHQAAERAVEIERLRASIAATGPLKDYELNADEKDLVVRMCGTVLDEIERRASEENDGK